MPLNTNQLSQFKEWVQEQFARQRNLGEQLEPFKEWMRREFAWKKKIEDILEILLGDFFVEPTFDLWETLEKHGVSKERFSEFSLDEKVDCVSNVCKPPTETVWHKRIAVLNMIFAERFGWPDGTVEELTPGQLLLALEHALEWDDPTKPSIWNITQ